MPVAAATGRSATASAGVAPFTDVPVRKTGKVEIAFKAPGPRPNGLQATLSEMTIFRYPSRDDMLVSTFTLEAKIGKSRTTQLKRQYWAREGGAWKIVFESMI